VALSTQAVAKEVMTMADFYQNGLVATLHRLNPDGVERLENELLRLSQSSPIGLVLPALYSEFERPAMRRIAAELAEVSYLREIVVVLGRANHAQYQQARSFFRGFRSPVKFIWLDSERVRSLFHLLEDHGISAGAEGKGRACWLAYGYLIARGECDVIAVHDCDIVNYDRRLLARLCYPLANPDFGFEFAKGYYARFTDRLHGRVNRLFLSPVVRAMLDLAPGADFLRFLDSFRYALAGEFAMKSRLAWTNRIPGDWGLEVGSLAEVYRNCPVSRVCQVDIADNYEHKHQDLSAGDPQRGLHKMTCDIAQSLFRTLAGEGVVFSTDQFRTLEARYVRLAEDTIERYYADAMLNGLAYNRHAEELAVATFAHGLRLGATEFAADPLGLPLIPNWNRVLAAVPGFADDLRDAVEEDARVAAVRAA
jgi:glucosyl-3-phosphoglycerate synthase